MVRVTSCVLCAIISPLHMGLLGPPRQMLHLQNYAFRAERNRSEPHEQESLQDKAREGSSQRSVLL